MFAISRSHCSSFLGAMSTTGSSLRASSGTVFGTTSSYSGTCFFGSDFVVFSQPRFACMANNSWAFFNSSFSAIMQELAWTNFLVITSVFSVCVGRLTHSFYSVAIHVASLATCCPSHSTSCWEVPYWVIDANVCTAFGIPPCSSASLCTRNACSSWPYRFSSQLFASFVSWSVRLGWACLCYSNSGWTVGTTFGLIIIYVPSTGLGFDTKKQDPPGELAC